jgi:hypothetical protein
MKVMVTRFLLVLLLFAATGTMHGQNKPNIVLVCSFDRNLA